MYLLYNSNSAIKGYTVPVMFPAETSEASPLELEDCTRHIIFTAETHNFPTGKCSYVFEYIS